MLQTVRKILKKPSLCRALSKKQVLLIVSIFIIFTFLIPLSASYAQDKWYYPPGYSEYEASRGFSDLLTSFIKFGERLLNWAMSNPFGFSFTNPAKNPIIELGWTLLRDITNMLFVLGLAYIGLATALNIAGFDTKKVFANLLIIALVINFTPIICGVIVDISNIISNFFLRNPNFGSLAEVFEGHRTSLTVNPLTWSSGTISDLILIAYAFLAGCILLLFAAIFIIRYLAIWLLVILSPIAFFAWIFDKTRKHFDTWWHQFLQWSFIAVPASFFLYLSQYLLFEASNDRLTLSPLTDSPDEGLFTSLAPYVTVLLLMIVAVSAALHINAKGTGAVIGFAKSTTKKGKEVTKKYAKRGAKKAAAETAAGVAGVVAGAKAGRGAGKITEALKGGFTRAGREKGREAGFGALERMHLVRPGFYEEMRGKRFKVEEERKRIKEASDERLDEFVERGTKMGATDRTIATSMAGLLELAERKKLTDRHRDAILQLKAKGIDTKTIEKEITKARPDWAPMLDPDKLEEEKGKFLTRGFTPQAAEIEARRKIIADKITTMTPGDFRNKIQVNAINEEVVAAMDAAKIRDIAIRGTSDVKSAIKQLTEQGTASRTRIVNRATAAYDPNNVNGTKARKARNRGDLEEEQRYIEEFRRITDTLREIDTLKAAGRM